MRNLLIALVFTLGLSGCSLLPTRVVYQDQKLSECVQAGGDYRLYKEYYRSNDYYAECTLPEKQLWRIDIDSSLTTK